MAVLAFRSPSTTPADTHYMFPLPISLCMMPLSNLHPYPQGDPHHGNPCLGHQWEWSAGVISRGNLQGTQPVLHLKSTMFGKNFVTTSIAPKEILAMAVLAFRSPSKNPADTHYMFPSGANKKPLTCRKCDGKIIGQVRKKIHTLNS